MQLPDCPSLWLRAWRSPVQRVQMHGTSNRETRLYPQQLICLFDNNIRAAHLPAYQWNPEWADNPARLRTFIPNTWTHRLGMKPPRTARIRLNGLRTVVRRFRSCLYRWSMSSSAACECGANEQTVDHIVIQCPIHWHPHGLHGLTVLDDETIEWLLNICPEI